VCFRKLKPIEDKLPRVDLAFSRDCLEHFSFTDIFSALESLCNSQSEYLLTTTFTERTKNHDIATGQWRVLNLEVAPVSRTFPLKSWRSWRLGGSNAVSRIKAPHLTAIPLRLIVAGELHRQGETNPALCTKGQKYRSQSAHASAR